MKKLLITILEQYFKNCLYGGTRIRDAIQDKILAGKHKVVLKEETPERAVFEIKDSCQVVFDIKNKYITSIDVIGAK